MTKTNSALNSVPAGMKLVKRCKDLIKLREDWELGAYKTSNDQLYEILASAYELYLYIFAGANKDEGKQFKALLTKQKVMFQENTPLHTRVVRLVFASNRKRSYTYGRVLYAARLEGIAPRDLPEWIRTNNGVEEVKIKSSGKLTPTELAKANADFAREELLETGALVTLGKLPKQLQPNAETNPTYSVALVRCDNGVDGEIVWGSANAGLIKQALVLAGRELTAEAAAKAAKAAKRYTAQKGRNAIKAATAKANVTSVGAKLKTPAKLAA